MQIDRENREVYFSTKDFNPKPLVFSDRIVELCIPGETPIRFGRLRLVSAELPINLTPTSNQHPENDDMDTVGYVPCLVLSGRAKIGHKRISLKGTIHHGPVDEFTVTHGFIVPVFRPRTPSVLSYLIRNHEGDVWFGRSLGFTSHGNLQVNSCRVDDPDIDINLFNAPFSVELPVLDGDLGSFRPVR